MKKREKSASERKGKEGSYSPVKNSSEEEKRKMEQEREALGMKGQGCIRACHDLFQ